MALAPELAKKILAPCQRLDTAQSPPFPANQCQISRTIFGVQV
ncbi:hypothetical protein E9O_01897 [Moraxella catarrhalis 12P80B1]|nr:hypothetical protein E9O_01897 [Moraxella catarrhalis 12P80B1]